MMVGKSGILLAACGATAMLAAGAGQDTIRVRDARTGAALPAAALHVAPGHGDVIAVDAQHPWRDAALPGQPGVLEVCAQMAGYRPLCASFEPVDGRLLPVTFWLDPLTEPGDGPGDRNVRGWVWEADGEPARGVALALDGTSTTSGADGSFLLRLPSPGGNADDLPATGLLRIVRPGHGVAALEREISLEPGQTVIIDLGDHDGLFEPVGQRLLLPAGHAVESPHSPSSGPDEPALPESVPWTPLLQVFNPPDTVRIGMNCSCTSCASVDVTSLETYVRRGLNDEWISSWDQDSLRAGAIAYRSYGAWYVNNPINANYDICSTTCCQVNDTDMATSTNTAAGAVSGIMLQRNSALLRSEYSAENNAWDDPGDGLSCTNADLSCLDGKAGSPSASWPCINDGLCAARGCFGHGRGECQWGTQRWATTGAEDWAWITNHYYNNHGAGTGYRTAQMTSPLAVSAATPTPANVSPGSSFTIQTSITNHAEDAHSAILLAATLAGSGLPTYTDVAHDVLVTLNPGANGPSRAFDVPGGAAPGVYDLAVALWYDVDGSGTLTSEDLQLTSLTNSAAVTVGGAGTCAQPIAITSFPYSTSNNTSGWPASLDGYGCPPSSGSEAGPEIVYAVTVTEPGNLTVTVSDGAGVDIDPHLLGGCNPSACIARNDTTFTVAVMPGTYTLVCDTWTSSGGTQYPGAFTLNVTFASTAGDTTSPAGVGNLLWNGAGTWTWNAVALDRLGGAETVDHYEVWRDVAPSGAGAVVGTPAPASWADAAVPPADTCWFYVVRAVDGAGNRDTPALDVVVDNPAASFAGSWSTGTSAAGKFGTDYRFVATGGVGTNLATWSFTPDESGLYAISTQYPAGANRSDASRFTVSHAGGSTLVPVNQQANGGAFLGLGSYWLAAGTGYTVVLDDAEPGGFVVIADAVRWTKP